MHLGRQDWPRTWSSHSLGKMEWVLCARKKHPLPDSTHLDKILRYPFIQPTYWTSEGLLYGNDFFPVQASKRERGYETSTADAAVPVLLKSDQLAFLPFALVQTSVQKGLVRLIHCDEIKSVKKDLFLSVRTDVAPASLHKKISVHFTEILKKMENY